MKSSFENLLSLKDAANMWHLEESTLRKAIAANKLLIHIDVEKFGKQWVIRKESMEQLYGYLVNNKSKECIINDIKREEIYYYIFDCFRLYLKKTKLNNSLAIKNFNRFNIYDYIIDCYDMLHLQSLNDSVNEINNRIKRGISYDQG